LVDDSGDDFGSGGKTEIADRPPSFYFEALGANAEGAGAAKRSSEAASPKAPLDEAETDSQQVDKRVSGAPAQPLVPGEESGAGSAPVDLFAAENTANRQANVPSASITDLPLAIDVPPASSAPAENAAPVPVGKESSWLDDALKATSDQTAVPEEAPSEPTQETSVGPDIAVPEAPALDDEAAAVAALGDRAIAGDLSESPTAEHGPGGGKSGKKLIIIGSMAACLAFAGVYLWMTKPWETQAPRQEAPVVAAPVAAPQPAPSAPAVPAPAPAAVETTKAAEPAAVETAKPSEPAKPAAVAPAEKPNEAAAEPASEAGKRGAPGKKAAAKTGQTPVTPPSTPAPAAAEKPAPAAGSEQIFLLKIKSVPAGAHVTMDGDAMGTTPFQRRILEIDKPHSIQVRKPGYDSYERTFTKADFGEPSGNTSTLNLSAKLTRLKSPSGPAAPAAGEPAEPAPEQPEKL